MRHLLHIIGISLAISLATPGMAHADCYVEYKAKQDSPLRLHYGILALPGDCPGKSRAQRNAQSRLAAQGWVLLNILGLSTSAPSDQQRANAGDYFLRF
jgi:hypothetical protein